MKNGLSLRQSLEHFIRSVADKTNAHTPKKRRVLLFFFLTLKDTEQRFFLSY